MSTGVAVASSLLALATPLAATGCTSADDMLPTMTVPPPGSAQSRAQAHGGAQSPEEGADPDTISLTRAQRDYLDALRGAGVRPSSDLLALSIGSYVCQAHAAKQSDQAVRDYVTPMVRNDIRVTEWNAAALPESRIDAVTDDYIRVATERLC